MGGISRSILTSRQEEIGEEESNKSKKNHQNELKDEFSVEKVDKSVSSELD